MDYHLAYRFFSFASNTLDNIRYLNSSYSIVADAIIFYVFNNIGFTRDEFLMLCKSFKRIQKPLRRQDWNKTVVQWVVEDKYFGYVLAKHGWWIINIPVNNTPVGKLRCTAIGSYKEIKNLEPNPNLNETYILELLRNKNLKPFEVYKLLHHFTIEINIAIGKKICC